MMGTGKIVRGPETRERPQSRGEEIANSISHGVGFLLAALGLPILIIGAIQRQSAAAVVGAAIFGGTVVLLYLTSALYHALPHNRAKQVFQILDHSAIFLLIAGTYTPFTLGVLRGAWGWSLFGVIWGLALFGVALKSIGGIRFPVLSTALYVAMGWLGLIAFRPLWLYLPAEGLAWLISGGLAYTAGVGFFAVDNIRRYAHFVWHLFVLAGTSCHFVAVLLYAM
jgi:hemolysin III